MHYSLELPSSKIRIEKKFPRLEKSFVDFFHVTTQFPILLFYRKSLHSGLVIWSCNFVEDFYLNLNLKDLT